MSSACKDQRPPCPSDCVQYRVKSTGNEFCRKKPTKKGTRKPRKASAGPTVAVLKDECRRYNLPVSGRKQELIDRLLAYRAGKPAPKRAAAPKRMALRRPARGGRYPEVDPEMARAWYSGYTSDPNKYKSALSLRNVLTKDQEDTNKYARYAKGPKRGQYKLDRSGRKIQNKDFVTTDRAKFEARPEYYDWAGVDTRGSKPFSEWDLYLEEEVAPPLPPLPPRRRKPLPPVPPSPRAFPTGRRRAVNPSLKRRAVAGGRGVLPQELYYEGDKEEQFY